MDKLHHITQMLIAFREERDWQKFHTPKNVAISLTLEATEVLELFQWQDDATAQQNIDKEKLADELADVFNWILILAHDAQIDIAQAAQRKIAKNGIKYPVEKSKGRSTKYTQL